MQSGGKTWFILPFQSLSGCFQRRVFAAVSPVTVCCGGIPHPLNVCLRLFSSVFSDLVVRGPALKGVWGTATIFFSLKPGIAKMGSRITSNFLGYCISCYHCFLCEWGEEHLQTCVLTFICCCSPNILIISDFPG